MQDKLTYDELSNKVYNAFIRHVRNEADYYVDAVRRQDFIDKQYRNNPKERYHRNSTLRVNFVGQRSNYLINSLRKKTIPDLRAVHLENLLLNFPKFALFVNNNLPETVDELHIDGSKIRLEKKHYRYFLLLAQTVKQSLTLKNFILTIQELEYLLKEFDHLESIYFYNCSIIESDRPLSFQGDFRNLKNLHMEDIGLKRLDIQTIIDSLIQKNLLGQIKYLNLFHYGFEPVLLKLNQKISSHGFKGNFKTESLLTKLWKFIKRVISFLPVLGRYILAIVAHPIFVFIHFFWRRRGQGGD
ncbi:unnamed protein product [Moneuplotes crassus]|uniref:Uncharacterized protein n=1 Tax=Euplotes crassus TaxID=5936 RepID=A0AAD1XJZ8_EUPCR|nr:unnamed protein product [Moneuplotes crassus]